MISRGIGHSLKMEEVTVQNAEITSYGRASAFLLLPSDLLHNLRDSSCAHRVAAFADREPQSLLHCSRRDQLDRQAYVVTRHDHLRPCRQLRYPGHGRRSQIKLRPVALEERRMPPTLFLGQNVDFGLELGVRRDRARLGPH